MTNDTDAIKVNEKLTLYRCANSKRWQARLLLENGEWHRFSTKTTDLDAAKDFALKQFYTADFRKNNNLPESTRKPSFDFAMCISVNISKILLPSTSTNDHAFQYSLL
ncbi:MAG: hypothetical protein KAT26_13715, partial [Marinosulfonomonas sp.]|nr:hypothetical protein [Marinosulfonomonas sp.]